MAWTTMHFAVGMAGAGLACGTACLITRRGWRFLPAAMTAGGIWGTLPDWPRFFREDFPSLPLSATLGQKSFERWLHSFGDVFFLHKQLDLQPREFALHGLVLILVLYNLAIALLMLLEWRQRNTPANRAYRAHGDKAIRRGRSHRSRRSNHSDGNSQHAPHTSQLNQDQPRIPLRLAQDTNPGHGRRG